MIGPGLAKTMLPPALRMLQHGLASTDLRLRELSAEVETLRAQRDDNAKTIRDLLVAVEARDAYIAELRGLCAAAGLTEADDLAEVTLP